METEGSEGNAFQRRVDRYIDSNNPAPTSDPSLPPDTAQYPLFPPHPEFDEIEWGPLPTKHQYKFAHRLWSLPNSTLEYFDYEEKENYPNTRDRPSEFLTRNVYADLMNSRHPQIEQPIPPDQLAQTFPNPQAPDGADGWTYEELGELAPARLHPTVNDVLVGGRNMKSRWLKQELLDELQRRNFGTRPQDERWTVKRCKDELFAHQAARETTRDSQTDIHPRHGLGEWGIPQRGHVDSCADTDRGGPAEDQLSPFRLYTWALHLSPYNPTYWVSRAYLFHQKGYFDLAVGDAYRAYFLTEVLHDEAKKATIPGLYARVWDAIEQHVYANAQNLYIPGYDRNDQAGRRIRADAALGQIRSPGGLLSFVPHLRRTLHHIISLNLLNLQAWLDWWKLDVFAHKIQGEEREYADPFYLRIGVNQGHTQRRLSELENDPDSWVFEKRAGSVSGKAFLQSANDVDRKADAFLATLNAKFLGPWSGKQARAPAIEVRQRENGELGVFALKAFEDGDIIHIEEPSIRGQVRGDWVWNRSRPEVCEHCKRIVYAWRFQRDQLKIEWWRLDESLRDQHPSICRCYDAEPPRYFCSSSGPQGLGIIGMNENPQQSTVSIDGDDTVATGATEGSSAQAKRIRKGKGKARAEDIGEGSSAQAQRSNAGKRKATDAPATEQPPTTRMTRSGARPAIPSKTRGRPATKKTRRDAKAPPGVSEPVTEEAEMTCLQKARQAYHFKTCGKAWEWLHRQLTRAERANPLGDTETVNYEEHGTLLSLLLLDVFDRTLLLRTSEPDTHIAPHEIDEMLPLCGGGEDLPDQYFPFTYSANIVVPFDILLNLGVNIFREPNFDTWVIQTVLRKLLLNCVPQDRWLKRAVDMIPDTDERVKWHGPFESLYVHTGYAMFNHGCICANNADWLWDEQHADEPWDAEIPNRIIVRAAAPIPAGKEITVGYFPGYGATRLKRRRLFGKECYCGKCPKTPIPGEELEEGRWYSP